jgi:tetratricopeptide (TPR) repeat protein
MELDMELDRVGGPSTEGLGFAELTNRGKEAGKRGAMLDAYGYFRDAIPMADSSTVMNGYRDSLEQRLSTIMNYTITAARHGKHQLAMYELEHVRSVDSLGDRYVVTLLELLSQRHRALGNADEAATFADKALEYAEKHGTDYNRAFACSNKAVTEYHRKNLETAGELFKKSFSKFRHLELHSESARALLNLAQTYYDQDRLGAAKRSLSAAERISIDHDLQHVRALARILLGEIAAKEGRAARAVSLWRQAIDVARSLHDTEIRFKAEFQLYKHAVEIGDASTASSMYRLLVRRSTRVSDHVEELKQFRLLSKFTNRTHNWVSDSQLQ